MKKAEKQRMLVKAALIWQIGEIHSLHEATGLFAREINRQKRITNALFDRQHAERLGTAYGHNLYLGLSQNELPEDHPSNDPEILQAIRHEQVRLELMPLQDLEKEVETLRLQNIDRKEEARLFNRPENRLHNLGHWARLSTWTPSQAILILGDREPSTKVVSYTENLHDYEIEDSPFAQAFFEVYKIMQSAIEVNDIGTPGRPLEYLRWFDKVKYDVPNELRMAILEFHAPDEWAKLNASDTDDLEPLMQSERASVLKIIAGMAICGYKFDHKAGRNEATRDIMNDMEQLGLGIDKNTLLKWLREACELAEIEEEKT